MALRALNLRFAARTVRHHHPYMFNLVPYLLVRVERGGRGGSPSWHLALYFFSILRSRQHL